MNGHLKLCPICHINYVLPYEEKEHETIHKAWLQDSSLTKEEYSKLISVDDNAFKNIRVDGYYYAGQGLFRKDIDNLLYKYEETQLIRGDMLDELQLEYIHQETIGLSLKQKLRIAKMHQWDLLQRITGDDELWSLIKERFGMTKLLRDDEE